MKPLPLAVVAVLLAAASLRSQEEDAAVSGEAGVTPAAPTATAQTFIRHSLEVPVFTPPPPPVVKQVPAMRVEASVTIPTKNGRTLTLIRGEASTAPDFPIPPAPQIEEARAMTTEELANMVYERRHMLSIGATIYDHKVSHVQWHNPDTGEFYEALCGFDVGLLGGIGEFVHAGESYSLMLIHSNLDSESFRQLLQNIVPAPPEIQADSIKILKGNPQDPIGTAPITLLKDIIASEKSRLVPFQAALRTYQEAAEAWHAAHPPIPRDETFWFKPHRGSRYLKAATNGGAQ